MMTRQLRVRLYRCEAHWRPRAMEAGEWLMRTYSPGWGRGEMRAGRLPGEEGWGHDASMSDEELLHLSPAEFVAHVRWLEARIVELEAELARRDGPPKTPQNSSTPPSKG